MLLSGTWMLLLVSVTLRHTTAKETTLSVTASADNYIVDGAGCNNVTSCQSDNNGVYKTLEIGRSVTLGERRTLLKFPLDEVSADELQEARLRLSINLLCGSWQPCTATNGNCAAVHVITTDWEEGSKAGNDATEGDSTWLHTSFPNEFWKTPGGDFDVDPIGRQMPGDVVEGGFVEFDLDVTRLSEISEDENAYFGFLIQNSANSCWMSFEPTECEFANRNDGFCPNAYPPQLVLTYPEGFASTTTTTNSTGSGQAQNSLGFIAISIVAAMTIFSTLN